MSKFLTYNIRWISIEINVGPPVIFSANSIARVLLCLYSTIFHNLISTPILADGVAVVPTLRTSLYMGVNAQ